MRSVSSLVEVVVVVVVWISVRLGVGSGVSEVEGMTDTLELGPDEESVLLWMGEGGVCGMGVCTSEGLVLVSGVQSSCRGSSEGGVGIGV